MKEEISIEDLYNGNFKLNDLDISGWLNSIYSDLTYADKLSALAHGCRFEKYGTSSFKDERINYLEILHILFLNVYYELERANAVGSNDFVFRLQVSIMNDKDFIKAISTMTDEQQITDFGKLKVNELKEKVVKCLEKIVKEIIDSVSYLYEKISSSHSLELDIFQKASKSSNKNVRLYCCARMPVNVYSDAYGAYDILASFRNDFDERVRKIAYIRINFIQVGSKQIPYNQLNFIKHAYESDAIKIKDKSNLFENISDKCPVEIYSFMFEQSASKDSYNATIDYDILYTIHDKRILYNEINNLILGGQIKFYDSYLPTYYESIKDSIKRKTLN